MQALKISIVTPSYNQGNFIEEAIQSVLAQNHQNFEHIIIDGGSTDNTLEVFRKYPHLKWVSESDKGQSDALNKGFLKAQGDWILWLNADDILFKGAIDAYLEAANRYKKSNVFYGHVLFFNENKAILKTQYLLKFRKYFTVLRINTPPTTGSFFKAELLQQNLLDTSFHYMMDVEWFCRCNSKIFVHVINKIVVGFRVSSSNKTSNQILHGILNEQQISETDRLYTKYFYPYVKKLPNSIQKRSFTYLRFPIKLFYGLLKLKYISKRFKKQGSLILMN